MAIDTGDRDAVDCEGTADGHDKDSYEGFDTAPVVNTRDPYWVPTAMVDFTGRLVSTLNVSKVATVKDDPDGDDPDGPGPFFLRVDDDMVAPE